MACARGWSWCIKEWTHEDDGDVVTAHHGAPFVIGDGAGVEVWVTALDDEPQPVVHVGDSCLTLAEATSLGRHLTGLATDVSIPATRS
jgi:hypothetical protein